MDTYKTNSIIDTKKNIETNQISVITNIIKNYCDNNKIIHDDRIKIIPTNEGLSNYIYHIIIENNSNSNINLNQKFFFKFFNNKTDRKFEEKIISLNSKKEKKNCSQILDTDFQTYRLEKFMENIRKLKREEIYTKNFEEICIEKLSEFNLDIFYDKENCIYNNKNVFNILKQNFFEAKKKFEYFENFFYEYCKNKIKEVEKIKKEKNHDIDINTSNNNHIKDFIEKEKNNLNFNIENFYKIKNFLEEKKFLEIFDEIFPKEFLNNFYDENFEVKNKNNNYTNDDTNKDKDNSKSINNIDFENFYKIPFVLSHNDVHINNFLVNTEQENFDSGKFTKENLMLIDYEYACFNIIGFDYVNLQIENFFDLEYSEYPFFSLLVENTKIIYEERYYEKYLNFMDIFLNKIANKKFFEYILQYKQIFLSKDYYDKVCRLASIFWFYTALKFLDFEDIIFRKGFNMLDYSIMRLSIYENFNLSKL
jgi:hypothetical protein